MSLRKFSVACFVIMAGALAGCVSNSSPHDHVVRGSDERVYNPQTHNYEWHTPGQPPTSAGATDTSRQPYR